MDERKAMSILANLTAGGRIEPMSPERKALDMAIQALSTIKKFHEGGMDFVSTENYHRQREELNAYKAIGTVEECRDAIDFLEASRN